MALKDIKYNVYIKIASPGTTTARDGDLDNQKIF